MKKSGAFSSLRNKVELVFREADSDLAVAREELVRIEDETIDDIIEKFRPNTTRVFIEALLSNLPGLPINPIGVFTGTRDVAAEKKKAEKLNWFYVLRDLRGDM